MARTRILLVLILALTAGGVFAYATYGYVQKNGTVETVAIPTKPVVVAAADLNIGAELKRDDIRIIDWPANAVPADAISNPEDVVGRGLIMPVVQNEPILPMKLASLEEGAGLPPVIPAGLRAMSVRVNEVIGVAGYVLPGTFVDVVSTLSPTRQSTDITSKVILTDVQVLAAGTRIEQDAEKDKPIPVSVVTLLENPDQPERQTLASTEGKIQLALRNPLDKGTPETRGIKPAVLMGTPSSTPRAVPRSRPSTPEPVVQPVPQGPPSMTVEIIRGDKREETVVRQD
jgi:pilus assembly protein CpaB